MASEGPVWLVDSPSEGELRVNPMALCILAKLPPPLQVVSIFGPRQSGKSYLLNIVAGSTGFTVSRDGSAKAPGIYMWSIPDPQGDGPSLVLLDTEGFEEDLAQDERGSCPMFTLSLLLSSIFLYNTWAPVDRNTLDQLLHVTMFTNMVSIPDRGWANKNLLPEFLWCVRDLDLQMYLGDVELMPADFLDAVLNEATDTQSPSGCVQHLFPRNRMKMFDFCHPKVDSGSDIEGLSLEDLNPSFIRQAESLRKCICRSKPKTFLHDQAVSGTELGVLLEHFVDSMSRGSIIHLDCVPLHREVEVEDVLDMEAVAAPVSQCIQPKTEQPAMETETLQRSEWVQTPAREHPGRSKRKSSFTRTEDRDLGDPVAMDRPVCLIENTRDNELQVNQDALNILSSIKQPVVVVSIVGMYRTGKSYLMNRLAGNRTGFSLGSTIRSETKGIWMWCVPHPCRNNRTLVLLDTEGLGDVEKGDQKNDHWIFALAILLSSTLVYNSMGTINNDAVMSLHYVTELTEHIKVKSNREKEEESCSEYVRFFPSFVWAVRDFTLELRLDEEEVTADQYLENSLKLKQGYSKAAALSNEARECIRNFFPSRKCFVFDQPTSKENLKKMEELSDADLAPAFLKQTSDFCSHIFNHSKEKTIKGGITVIGRLLGNLAVTYVDAIRSGNIPCLENAVQALSQIENSTALEQSLALYKMLLRERVELHTETQEELSTVHEGCLKEALENFMDHSFKDEDQHYQKNLMERIKEEYEEKCRENEQISQNHCAALIVQLEDSLSPQESYMKPGGYSRFRNDLDGFVELYKETPGKGVKAEQVLEEYLKEKSNLGKTILTADRNLSEQQRRVEEERTHAKIERQKAEAAKKQQRVMKTRLEDMDRAYRENERQLLEKLERDRKAALAEHQRVLDQRLREQSTLLREGFNENARKMEAEIQQLRHTLNESQRQRRGGGGCVIS